MLLLVVFGTMKHAQSEQVKLCPPIHASLEQFEPRDLPFRLTATPGQSQTGTDSGLILPHRSLKRLEFWDVTGFRSFQPCLQLLTTAFTHHLEKLLHQLIRRLNLGTGLPDRKSMLLAPLD